MEVIIVTTHLRNAAGACALSIGLLVCSSGGAIAFADQTDAGGAAAGSPGATRGDGTTTATSTGSTSTVGTQPTDTDTDTDAVEGKVTTVGTETTTTSVTIGNGPTSTVQAQTNTSTKTEEDPDLVTIAVLDLDKIGITPGAILKTPLTQALTPSGVEHSPSSGSDPAAESAKMTEGNEYTAAVTTGAEEEKKTFAFGLTDRELDPISNAVVVPFTNAAVTLARGLGQGIFTLAQVPTSETPLADLVEGVSLMVGGVVGAVVEVAKVPGNLVTLLGVEPGDVQPPLIGASGAVVPTVHTPVDVPLLGPVSQAQLPVATVGAPLFGPAIRAANPGSAPVAGLKNDLTLSGLAPAPSGVSPATKSFLDHVVSSVLVPASLTALAAIAVPGIGGLLIVCAAGIRVGYRQAKAGLALRASGIARFAGPGPMGIVRSGSLIALHTRTARHGSADTTPAVSAKAATGPRLLESVA